MLVFLWYTFLFLLGFNSVYIPLLLGYSFLLDRQIKNITIQNDSTSGNDGGLDD